MWFIAIAVLIGAVVGRLRGGSPSEIAAKDVRWLSLLLLGMAARLLSSGLDLDGASLPLIASFLLIGGFAAGNLRLVGMPIFLFGLFLNFAPVAVNDGMPVRPEAVVSANVAGAGDLQVIDLGAGRHLETDGDSLTFLGDIVPVPFLREVVSFGDLILAVGLADMMTNLMLPARRRKRLPERRLVEDHVALGGEPWDGSRSAEADTEADPGEGLVGVPHEWREVDPEPPAVRIFDIEAEDPELAPPEPEREHVPVVVDVHHPDSRRAAEAAAAVLRGASDTG